MLLLSFGDGEMRGRISVIACGRFRGRGIDNDRHVAVRISRQLLEYRQ